uniref:Ig-like domain-containing protein n=1 Tax=Rhodnius prolixus TaxID=13249 RepID=T1I1G6_RHOPR
MRKIINYEKYQTFVWNCAKQSLMRGVPTKMVDVYEYFKIPPDIIDSGTSSDTIVEEGDNVTLVCTARGHPPPRIVWRREDGRSITVYNNSTGFSTSESKLF